MLQHALCWTILMRAQLAAALEQVPCPACGHMVGRAGIARHQARCCPELLNPDGWHAGDAATVEALVVQQHGFDSTAHQLARLRFGLDRGLAPRSYEEVAAAIGVQRGRAVSDVQRLMGGLPLVADPPPGDGHLRVIFEDDALLVIDKPAGVRPTPRNRYRGGSVLNWCVHHGVATPKACHRLDADTTGVLTVAKSADAARHATRQFAAATTEKAYLAIATFDGSPPAAEFEVEAAVASGKAMGEKFRERKLLLPRRGESSGGEGGGGAATTAVRTLLACDGVAVLLAMPKQGRTHQVRLHLSHAGLPILGDRQYGGAGGEMSRHALHAASLCLDHPTTGERHRFVAPLPEDMRDVIRRHFCGGGVEGAPPDPEAELSPWWGEASGGSVDASLLAL